MRIFSFKLNAEQQHDDTNNSKGAEKKCGKWEKYKVSVSNCTRLNKDIRSGLLIFFHTHKIH